MEHTEFVVVEPPTSASVEELAYNMMSTGGLLPLIIRNSNDLTDNITMHINQQNGNEDGSISLAGRIVDTSIWVNLHLASDKQEPATGFME